MDDCFLCHVDVWFSPSRSSQVNPNSTRSIAWVLEGVFVSSRVRRESSSDATGHNKDLTQAEIARAMSLAPRVPVRCQCFGDMF